MNEEETADELARTIKEFNENRNARKGETFVKALVPDGGWGWIVCISCLVGNIAVGGIVLSFGIILPALKDFYREGTFATSLVGSLMTGFTYGTAPIAAALTNQIGIRGVYMIGSVIAFFSFFLSAFSSNCYVLMILFGVIGGTGLGLILMPISVACNLYFEKKRPLATGISKTGFSIGGFLFPLIIQSILDDFGWRGVVWVYGITASISLVFASFVKPLELVFTEPLNDGDTKVTNRKDNKVGSSNKRSNNIFRKKTVSQCDDENFGNSQLEMNLRFARNIFKSLEEPKIDYTRNPRLQRRMSIIQLESIKKDFKEEKVKNVEFIFKPNAPEGSKLFLPPLARTDTFYDGSLANLFGPIASNKNISPAVDAHSGETHSVVCMSVFDEPSRYETSIYEKVTKLVDISIWRNLPISMLFLSRFFGNFSITIFFIEFPSMLLENGFSMKQASILLTIIGLANSIPRIFVAPLMDHPRVNSCILIGAGFLIEALLLCALPFTFDYPSEIIYGIIIGISNCPYWVGLSGALGRMVPLEKVASTCGIMSIAQGLGSALGPPIAGLVFDATQNYSFVSYISAIGLLISGISSCCATYMHQTNGTN